jgi:hypothetical protein
LLEFLGHSYRSDEEGFLTSASDVKLHENPVRVVNKYAADLTVGVCKTVEWPGQLHSFGSQVLGQGFYVRNSEGDMADSNLI